MKPRTAPKPGRHVRASDLRALSLLVVDANAAVTTITEEVHQSVWRTLGAPSGATAARTRGLTGLIYKSINGVSHWVGRGVGSALVRLEPWLQQLEGPGDESPQRAAFIAALNGVMGDRLQASGHPLATPMTLRFSGKVLDWTAPPEAGRVTGKVLIVIHGLCMNELQWTSQHAGEPVNHAGTLSAALGYTPVYVRYNSGLHVSENGHELDRQLGELLAHWPAPVTELTVLSHSMGGLIARSALQVAGEACQSWPKVLRHIVFLGTPHHGSPLERAGNWIDVILGSTPYTRPFVRLGRLRSAGVTDLRYGHVQDADWQGHDRFRRRPDSRIPAPLPQGVNCFAVAATLAARRGHLADRLTGDGLVPLHSALGQHDDSERVLHFAPERQYIAYRTGHLQLLSSPQVNAQLLTWLALSAGRASCPPPR